MDILSGAAEFIELNTNQKEDLGRSLRRDNYKHCID